jgi:integrase
MIDDIERTNDTNRRNLTFNQAGKFLESYYDEKRPSITYSTLKKHYSGGRTILRFMDLTGLPWGSDSMERFIEYCKDGRASGTTNNLVRFARAWTFWLYQNGHVKNPFYKKLKYRFVYTMIKCPHVPFHKYFPAIMEVDEITGHLFVLGYMTGMAVADCANLRWSQVDIEKGFINVKRLKTGNLCQIPIDQTVLLRHLLAMREQFDLDPPDPASFAPNEVNDFVCPDAAEICFTGSGLQNRIKRACAKMGLPPVRWHDLRRAFCTRLIDNGVNIIIASRMTGHRSIAILNHYATISDSTLRSSFDSANKAANSAQFA